MVQKGRLGVSMSVTGTNKEVYQVPADTVTTATISVVNTGSLSATVTIYITNSNSPGAQDTIEFNTVLTPGGVLERTCVPMSEGEKVIVNASNSECAIRISGFEDELD